MIFILEFSMSTVDSLTCSHQFWDHVPLQGPWTWIYVYYSALWLILKGEEWFFSPNEIAKIMIGFPNTPLSAFVWTNSYKVVLKCSMKNVYKQLMFKQASRSFIIPPPPHVW